MKRLTVDRQIRRRALLARLVALPAALACGSPVRGQTAPRQDDLAQRRWYEAAQAMLLLAQSWGDQPYGAVLVRDGRVIGEGPSRVVKSGDATAHAEREAIRDAQRRFKPDELRGSVLYSTSRPCSACEAAAAVAGVARMVYGADLRDAGVPRPR